MTTTERPDPSLPHGDWAATLLAVSQAVGGTLDLAETMRRVAREAARALGADMVGAYLVSADGAVLEPIAGYRVPAPLRPAFAAFPFPVRGHPFIEEARDRQGPVWTSDAEGDARIDRATIARFPHRSVLFSPMFVDGAFTGGLFVVWFTEARAFPPEAVELASAITRQAAIAVSNARLYENVERRRQEAEVLAELVRAINASTDLDTVLERITAGARRLCRADIGRIALAVPGTPDMMYRYWVGPRAEVWRARPVEPGKGLAGAVMVSGRAMRTADYTTDPAISPDYLATAREERLVAAMVVPIGTVDQMRGLLFVANQSARPFTDGDEAIVARLADHAAIAIDNVERLAREQEARALAQRTAAALRESEERYRQIVDGSLQGILIHQDHVVRFANPALLRLFGVARAEDVLGRSLDPFLPPAELARLLEIRQARRRGEPVPVRYEVEARRRDGTSIWLDLLVSPIVWDGADAVLATMIDITERRQAAAALRQSEEQLRQAQKMEAIGQLAGGIAHDFNNLLTVIQGRTDLARGRLGGPSPLDHDLALIEKTAERASALTGQLLAFSRRQILQPRVLDLSAVVRGTQSLLRRLIGEDIDLVTNLAADLGPTLADPVQIEQVIMNLAVNARDAMPGGGRLTIETVNVELDEAAARQHGVRPGPHAVLAVTDEGSGMAPDTLRHIFEPFFTTKATGKGTGLGLATVYGIVRQSGGHISVHSQPGHGSTFRVYLPRVTAAPEPVASGPAAAAAGGGAETVLLVEDETDLRQLAREVLEARGYTVLEAPEASMAAQIAHDHPGPIHLLVTDVVMPRASGPQVAREVTARRPETRVLYMSGYTDDTVLRHGVLERGMAFIHKPFSPSALALKIREVLDEPR